MEIRRLAKIISDFSMLPAFILNLERNTVEVLSVGSVREDVFSIINTRLLLSIAEQYKDIVAYRYVHSTELSLLFYNDAKGRTLVFGPFYVRSRESENLISAIEKYYSTSLSSQRKTIIVDSIRVKDSFFSDAWKDIVCAIQGIPSFELEEFRDRMIADGRENTISEIAASRMIVGDVSLGYGFEKKIRKAVVDGDKDKLLELLIPGRSIDLNKLMLGNTYNIKYRFEGNKDYSLKNAQIILNTIFRISAEDAGLPPLYLHSISDGISKAIEQEKDEKDAFNVLEKMINSYCDAINRTGIGNRSYRVTRVQKYILTNLTSDLPLEKLAEIADTSPQHLSRLFKKECGVTITQYIRTQRIHEAELLIRTTDEPILGIAESLGFSSQNYFCNVFKAETGMTPSQYKAKSELTRNEE